MLYGGWGSGVGGEARACRAEGNYYLCRVNKTFLSMPHRRCARYSSRCFRAPLPLCAEDKVRGQRPLRAPPALAPLLPCSLPLPRNSSKLKLGQGLPRPKKGERSCSFIFGRVAAISNAAAYTMTSRRTADGGASKYFGNI